MGASYTSVYEDALLYGSIRFSFLLAAVVLARRINEKSKRVEYL
jgi:hypothetical protein